MAIRPFSRVFRDTSWLSASSSAIFRVVAVVLILAPCSPRAALAQGRTDVVTLANSDRITGEVARLERGLLEFKTDDAGTLYLEWDKLVSLIANRSVEVLTTDGRRFLGTLGGTTNRTLAVVGVDGGVTTLQMSDVTLITPIGRSFWAKLDGSIDAGFNYTQSSGIAQLNVNSDTLYRKPASSVRVNASLTQTAQEESDSDDDRGYVQAAYLRYPWQHWFFTGAARFETNESLGLTLRSQVGGAIGPRLVNSIRAQMIFGVGAVFNDERGVDVEPSRNLEGLLAFRASYFTYDRPKTNLDISLQYYPGLTDTGRHRVQLDAGVKREIWADFFVGLNLYNSFDNRPPNPTANQNDFGISASIGWTY